MRRVIIFTLAFVLIVIGAVVWILHTTIHEFWSNTLSIIFVAGGIVVGLLQWLFPMPTNNSNPNKLPPPTPYSSPNPASTKSPATVISKSYPYDVAISYAGEDNAYADALAKALKDRGVKVFYDKYEKVTLWGKNLYDYLSDLYQHKARYCVVLLSQHYAKKVWTNLERQSAQARAFQENQEYILPIRLDDTEIPGILPTVDYLRWPPETAESIADITVAKLA